MVALNMGNPDARQGKNNQRQYGENSDHFLTALVNVTHCLKLQKYCTEKNFKLIDLLEERGKAYNATVAQMALAWMFSRPAITAPIIGANSVAQLKEILGCLKVKLSAEDVQAIDAASEWRD